MKIIGKIHTDFPEKFGVPRQSGIIKGLKGKIVFEKEYQNEQAFRGLEGFSHIWVIWQFSKAIREDWSPTVKPPRLGGNKRMGVFATRSPFRPNPIGLSCLKLDSIVKDEKDGIVLNVSGIDMMDGTPVYDIKPYLPYADCYPDAKGGFADDVKEYELEVDIPAEILGQIPEKYKDNLIEVLKQDPRPGYAREGKEFGITYGDINVRFVVMNGVLVVLSLSEA